MVNKNTNTIFWSFVEKISANGVQFLITIILARLLTPDDYGLIAMIAIFYSFSQALIDSGFASALIQKKDCSQQDYNAVFFFNIFISVLIYIILFFVAPLIADYYSNELLVNIIRVYCLNLIVNALFMVHRTVLIKHLKFKLLAVISLISSSSSGLLAIILAYLGFTYWALVWQILFASVLSFIIVLITCKWKPTVEFSFVSLKHLFPFGFNILLTAILNSIYNNLYSLIIGRKYNSVALGYYNRANSLASTVPIAVADFTMKALYPIHSKIQDEDEKLDISFINSLKILMLFIVPFNLFLSANAQDILVLLIGDKWLEAVPFFSILSIAFIFYPMLSLNINMLKVKGRADYVFRSELIKKIIGVVLVCITSRFGILVMVYGLLFYSVLDIVISTVFVQRVCKITPQKQFSIVFLIALCAILALLVSYYSTSFLDDTYIRLFICGALYILLYFALCMLVKLLSFKEIKGIIDTNIAKNK
jgi:O-antigen/teichoic acid export membrane protein